MIIQYVGPWDKTYPLYRASWRGVSLYGCTHLQALSNMLGYIEGLKWENYTTNLN